VATATGVTATQCAALLTPTQAQLLAIRRYNNRLGRVAARVSFRAFIKSCKKAQTKVTVKPNSKQLLRELVAKYCASLRAQRIPFQLSYEEEKKKVSAVYVFVPGDAPKLKALADNTFTAEDYESLELTDVEGFEAASASNLVTSIAAAVVAVISVNV
jgi:Ni,Fe-hydrogenase III component G